MVALKLTLPCGGSLGFRVKWKNQSGLKIEDDSKASSCLCLGCDSQTDVMQHKACHQASCTLGYKNESYRNPSPDTASADTLSAF